MIVLGLLLAGVGLAFGILIGWGIRANEVRELKADATWDRIRRENLEKALLTAADDIEQAAAFLGSAAEVIKR